MLSYRHAFHAGNHADTLKHYVLGLVLDYMNQKDKPYLYIDTHAGAGMYSLTEGYAIQNAEFKEGISKLIASDSLPKPLEKFVAQIKRFNTNSLEFYPGSPMVAQDFLMTKCGYLNYTLATANYLKRILGGKKNKSK